MATEKVLGSAGLEVVKEILDDNIAAIDDKIGNLSLLGTAARDNLVDAINEVYEAVPVGAEMQVSIDTSTTTTGYLKSYTVKQGDATVGVIDIPKDLVVVSGTVEVDPEGQAEGTYIKLVIANQDEPLYINVGSLVDIYTAVEAAPQIQVTVDNSTRKISAALVEGGIDTAIIADGAITLVKLASDVTDEFDSLDSRTTALEEKVGEGIEFLTEEEIRAIFEN